jgi:NADH-quinone oxidoreductase subunit L
VTFPLWLIPLLPLVGFAVNGLLSLASAGGRNGPSRGFAAFVAVLMPALSFAVTAAAFGMLMHADGSLNVSLRQTLWEWLPVGKGLGFGLHFDRLTALMLLFITGIGTLIHVYSIGYMKDDRGFARFMAYLNLFMASMIILVLGDSLPAAFLGWEGVGLCSYLLIGFWHHDHGNNDAARKAFVMNRIGDLGFLLGVFCLYWAMGKDASLRFADIAEFFRGEGGHALAGTPLVVAACALLFLGCTGKSAQIPLLGWLPDAMAGPTPVSALIHAATMVTSGVYLCARLADVFVLAPQVMSVIAVIGCATAFFGAIAGLVQWDIKKVLAYSTVSQLGFMFMAVGVGAFDVALFHVLTHAFFKATLFLGAGSVIHGLHHEQDMRRMGGLAKAMPITYSTMWFGWFAIIGLPLGSGFMSKDLILERLLESGGPGRLLCALALLAALLTAIYMSRMMYLVFWSPSRLDAGARDQVHESPATMTVPLLILGLGSMCIGVVWFAAMGLNDLEHWLAPVLQQAQAAFGHGGAEAASAAASGVETLGLGEETVEPARVHGPAIAIASLGTAAAVIGWLIARWLWRRGPKSAEVAPLSGFAAAWTFAFDRFYGATIEPLVEYLALFVGRVVNDVLLDSLMRSFGWAATFFGEGYAAVQRSRVRVSLGMSLIGALALLAYLLMPFLGKGL